MVVTVVEHEHEHHEPEHEPEHHEPERAAQAIVEGAADLADTVTDAAAAAAEQARVEALDTEALRKEIRDQVEAEYAIRKAETEAAVAEALAAAAPEPEPEPEPTEDLIAPHRSHPWFRSPGEWFGSDR